MIGRAVAGLLLVLIRAYQVLISPLLGPCCRYLPSCSDYAADAIRIHGPLRGSWLALRRVSRCHPFHSSGYDPVPQGEESGP
jgi:putative membrane protein insertion efficiency factor